MCVCKDLLWKAGRGKLIQVVLYDLVLVVSLSGMIITFDSTCVCV